MSAPAWLEEGKRLRARGFTYAEIAKVVCRSQGNISLWLNPDALERKRSHNRARMAALFAGTSPHRLKAERKPKPARPKAGEQDPRIMAATLAFARYEIDRDELMRRIGP